MLTGGRAQVDVAFEGAEALQPLARLAYALLRSPLLGEPSGGGPAQGAGGDAAVAARHLWAALPPGELRRAPGAGVLLGPRHAGAPGRVVKLCGWFCCPGGIW